MGVLNVVEKFPAVLEILPQVLRGGGDFFLTHTVSLVKSVTLVSSYFFLNFMYSLSSN